MLRAMFLIGLFTLLSTHVQAEEIELKGLHLCCGGCVVALESSLEIDGVSDIAIDRRTGSATFKTADAKTTQAVLKSINEEGFYGKTKVDGKAFEFPVETVKEGATAKQAVFEGVHLCCGACTRGVVRALEKEDSLAEIVCDQKSGTVSVKSKGGAELDLAKLQKLLNGAGFSGSLKSE